MDSSMDAQSLGLLYSFAAASSSNRAMELFDAYYLSFPTAIRKSFLMTLLTDTPASSHPRQGSLTELAEVLYRSTAGKELLLELMHDFGLSDSILYDITASHITSSDTGYGSYQSLTQNEPDVASTSVVSTGPPALPSHPAKRVRADEEPTSSEEEIVRQPGKRTKLDTSDSSSLSSVPSSPILNAVNTSFSDPRSLDPVGSVTKIAPPAVAKTGFKMMPKPTTGRKKAPNFAPKVAIRRSTRNKPRSSPPTAQLQELPATPTTRSKTISQTKSCSQNTLTLSERIGFAREFLLPHPEQTRFGIPFEEVKTLGVCPADYVWQILVMAKMISIQSTHNKVDGTLNSIPITHKHSSAIALELLKKWPTAADLTNAEVKNIDALLAPLDSELQGLDRSQDLPGINLTDTLLHLADKWIHNDPYIVPHGMKSWNSKAASALRQEKDGVTKLKDLVPRWFPTTAQESSAFWRVSENQFVQDAFRIFAIDKFHDNPRRPPTSFEWQNAKPTDVTLRAFLAWKWSGKRMVWDPVTGETGRLEWENDDSSDDDVVFKGMAEKEEQEEPEDWEACVRMEWKRMGDIFVRGVWQLREWK